VTPVFILPSATADLDEIYEYIARDNAAAAERHVVRLVEAARRLSAFPLRGRARPALGDTIRSIVEGQYVILYRAGTERVDVVRFIHGARDLEGLVDREGE
jgi:toxin ParE1/3/4